MNPLPFYAIKNLGDYGKIGSGIDLGPDVVLKYHGHAAMSRCVPKYVHE